MKSIRSLIFADAVIKLVLGVLLIVFPNSVVTFLGLPPADPSFYPSVLGAVLFGIGIAFFEGDSCPVVLGAGFGGHQCL
jgi:hypothetical protein